MALVHHATMVAADAAHAVSVAALTPGLAAYLMKRGGNAGISYLTFLSSDTYARFNADVLVKVSVGVTPP